MLTVIIFLIVSIYSFLVNFHLTDWNSLMDGTEIRKFAKDTILKMVHDLCSIIFSSSFLAIIWMLHLKIEISHYYYIFFFIYVYFYNLLK